MKTKDRLLNPFFYNLSGVRDLGKPSTMKTRNYLPSYSKEPPVFSLVVAPRVDFSFTGNDPEEEASQENHRNLCQKPILAI